MTRLRLLACAALALPCLAQNTPELARILSFEVEHTGSFPAVWGGNPHDSIALEGLGVFYPEKKPTQRVRIVPDVEVKPTIAGIVAGQDELLEEAIKRILGSDATPETIQKMLKH